MRRHEGRRPRWSGRSAVAAVAALSLLAAACGGDDDDADTGQPTGGTATAGTATAGTDTGTGADTAGTDTAGTATGTDSAGPGASSDGDEPQSGGRLVYGFNFEPAGFDPTMTLGITGVGGDAPALAPVFDSLIHEDMATGELRYQLAESLTSTDAVEWTLTLRPDVRFSDGTPLDAAAVKFNWERIAATDTAPTTAAARSIVAMEVVDEVTLAVTLDEPNAAFPRIVARRLPWIGSPTAIEERGDGFAEDPVGAGPFLLTEWTRGGEMRFTRNPDYWNAPKPYLDELVVRIVPDDTQRYNAFTAGELDLTDTVNPLTSVEAKSAGQNVQRVTPGGGWKLIFNQTRPPFDDVRARLAVAHALDRATQNDVVFNGGGVVPETLFPEGSPFYDPDQLLPAYDPDEAQRLLDELADERGEPLSFTLIYTAPTMEAAAEYYQAQLASFDNLEVSIEPIAGVESFPSLVRGDFAVQMFTSAGFDVEPDFRDAYVTGGSRNFSKYSSEEMDAALTAGRTSLDEADRADAYREMQRLLVEDVPETYFTRLILDGLYGDAVHGYEHVSVGPTWDRIWLEE